jgi:hypothetical protein
VIAEPGETISPIFAADSICEKRCCDESVAILGRNGVDCSRLVEPSNRYRRNPTVCDLLFSDRSPMTTLSPEIESHRQTGNPQIPPQTFRVRLRVGDIISHPRHGVGAVYATNWRTTSVAFCSADDAEFDARDLSKIAIVLEQCSSSRPNICTIESTFWDWKVGMQALPVLGMSAKFTSFCGRTPVKNADKNHKASISPERGCRHDRADLGSCGFCAVDGRDVYAPSVPLKKYRSPKLSKVVPLTWWEAVAQFEDEDRRDRFIEKNKLTEQKKLRHDITAETVEKKKIQDSVHKTADGYPCPTIQPLFMPFASQFVKQAADFRHSAPDPTLTAALAAHEAKWAAEYAKLRARFDKSREASQRRLAEKTPQKVSELWQVFLEQGGNILLNEYQTFKNECLVIQSEMLWAENRHKNPEYVGTTRCADISGSEKRAKVRDALRCVFYKQDPVVWADRSFVAPASEPVLSEEQQELLAKKLEKDREKRQAFIIELEANLRATGRVVVPDKFFLPGWWNLPDPYAPKMIAIAIPRGESLICQHYIAVAESLLWVRACKICSGLIQTRQTPRRDAPISRILKGNKSPTYPRFQKEQFDSSTFKCRMHEADSLDTYEQWQAALEKGEPSLPGMFDGTESKLGRDIYHVKTKAEARYTEKLNRLGADDPYESSMELAETVAGGPDVFAVDGMAVTDFVPHLEITLCERPEIILDKKDPLFFFHTANSKASDRLVISAAPPSRVERPQAKCWHGMWHPLYCSVCYVKHVSNADRKAYAKLNEPASTFNVDTRTMNPPVAASIEKLGRLHRVTEEVERGPKGEKKKSKVRHYPRTIKFVTWGKRDDQSAVMFAIVPCPPSGENGRLASVVDVRTAVPGHSEFKDVKKHYRERISIKERTCALCGTVVDSWRKHYCHNCAQQQIWNVKPAKRSVEIHNTEGKNARNTERQARRSIAAVPKIFFAQVFSFAEPRIKEAVQAYFHKPTGLGNPETIWPLASKKYGPVSFKCLPADIKNMPKFYYRGGFNTFNDPGTVFLKSNRSGGQVPYSLQADDGRILTRQEIANLSEKQPFTSFERDELQAGILRFCLAQDTQLATLLRRFWFLSNKCTPAEIAEAENIQPHSMRQYLQRNARMMLDVLETGEKL